MTQQRAIYIGPNESLSGEACTIETCSGGVRARFDEVRTGMNIDWHGPFDLRFFDTRNASIEALSAARPIDTA